MVFGWDARTPQKEIPHRLCYHFVPSFYGCRNQKAEDFLMLFEKSTADIAIDDPSCFFIQILQSYLHNFIAVSLLECLPEQLLEVP